MNLTEAARATRKYYVMGDGRGNYRVCDHNNLEEYDDLRFTSDEEVYSFCDRLNLAAVLEAIREPTGQMNKAGYEAFEDGYIAVTPRYKAMIDALIAEVKK